MPARRLVPESFAPARCIRSFNKMEGRLTRVLGSTQSETVCAAPYGGVGLGSFALMRERAVHGLRDGKLV